MFPTNLLPGPASDGGNPPAPVVPPSRPASRRPASAAFPAAPFREASREPASIATLPAPPESAIMPPEPREPPAPVEAPPVFIDPLAKRPPVPAPGDAPPEEVAPPPSSDDPQAASVSVATRSEANRISENVRRRQSMVLITLDAPCAHYRQCLRLGSG